MNGVDATLGALADPTRRAVVDLHDLHDWLDEVRSFWRDRQGLFKTCAEHHEPAPALLRTAAADQSGA